MSDGNGAAILGWWSAQIGDRQSAAARGLSARLRRGGALDILAEPPVHDLSRRLGLRDAPTLIRLVGVLAHVREHRPQRLAQRLGQGDPPALSSLRFQRLIRAQDDDLTAALVRALPLAGHACNVAALGADLMFWTDDTRGRWCFDYFGTAVPRSLSPDPDPDSAEEARA